MGADRPGRDVLAAAETVEAAVQSLGGTAGAPGRCRAWVRISATDGFSAFIASPAAADVQREHPGVSVEIVAAIRRAPAAFQRGSGDRGREPTVHRAQAIRLGDYCLGLYGARATRRARHPAPPR
jgi:DNA-binding transcriptional LysR family regulator